MLSMKILSPGDSSLKTLKKKNWTSFDFLRLFTKISKRLLDFQNQKVEPPRYLNPSGVCWGDWDPATPGWKRSLKGRKKMNAHM